MMLELEAPPQKRQTAGARLVHKMCRACTEVTGSPVPRCGFKSRGWQVVPRQSHAPIEVCVICAEIAQRACEKHEHE